MNQTVSKGTFLIASPTLIDPNFRRTVVLLCEHSQQGSLGLIINRPTSLKIKDVLPDFPELEARQVMAYVGGPVQQSHLLVLHRLRHNVPGSLEICDGIYLGGEFAYLKKLFTTRLESDEVFRVYLGYAGWGSKQLDFELGIGSWITCPATSNFIFDPEPSKIWQNILKSMGGKYDILSQMPPDPNFN